MTPSGASDISRTATSESPFPEDFYGFPDVPFHIHLQMRFSRPDPTGPAEVVLPAAPERTGVDSSQSTTAVFTVGEVAAGIAVCDALLLHATEAETSMIPLVLTRTARFRSSGAGHGEIRSQTEFVGDAGAAVAQLMRTRKVRVETVARLYGDNDDLAAEMDVGFYVRLMELSRLEAMAQTLMPRMQGAGSSHTPASGSDGPAGSSGTTSSDERTR